MVITAVLWDIVTRFGSILAAPIRNPDMLWIIVPIYINWIFTDYLQERKGTDFGNAITNGVIQLWVGVDWIRQSVKEIAFNAFFLTKAIICMISIAWGLLIMVEGARAKPITHYIGRVREITYFMIVATPIFYGVIKPDLLTIGAILLFFPIFYGLGEAIDRLLPAPPGEDEMSQPDMKISDLEPGPSSAGMPSAGGDFGTGGGMPQMPKF